MSQIYKVYSIVAGIYTVVHNDLVLKIPAAGKLRYLELQPIVGDNVLVKDGQLVEILERKNEFIRPKVANVDQMLVFMSIKEPEFQPFLVDKYLAIIESKKIKPVLCFTKVDLDQEQASYWANYYKQMGYEVILINNSKIEETTLNALKSKIKDKYSVFMGQSGVGKTTTLNSLGNYSFETQQISKALGRGKHTTRVVSIIEFNDGFLIDTPGFSSLELELSKIELAQSFESFQKLAQTCKFRSCLHNQEPKDFCAIKQNIGTNLVPELRYKNYLKLLSELE
ncbi:ribosome small subunit-dependent GTPase A [Mycoplasmopsis gallopavonis]|uniref:Small ribosomal subunit biogenesis GTPase RsgA n=1 Tax=Mycoplasmopsis gallopavonis TaxID=76629 RepID=A0A449B0C9_9BACT|nr:ribosome small subunit-dependent GTPase A [Mycoplasmopsis gallopavonis]RIV16463.1 ribosome small subunit-dependent GTPase A [Mycoplasmopsis gallopavonis]VEU73194.1 putative GTPase engC [Mycoplasmopsis gallopavonis]